MKMRINIKIKGNDKTITEHKQWEDHANDHNNDHNNNNKNKKEIINRDKIELK